MRNSTQIACTFALALIGATALLPISVWAQDADALPDVGDRYDGTGTHVGSFWLLPTIETGLFYDSNVNASSDDAEDGWGGYISPRLDLKSDWGRHALDISLGASHFEYFDGPDDSRTNFDGSVEARIDVQRDLVIIGGLKGGMFDERVGDLNASALADEATRHREYDAYASLNKAFNRLSVSVGGAYTVYDYDDVDSVLGGEIDQDFRDGDTQTVGGRVSYEFSPGYRMFADTRYNWRHYESNVGESDGWRGLAGVEFEITRLVRGEIGVGYMEQYYDDGDDEGGISYHAGLIWNPTPLMTVNLDADRVIADSAVAGSSGMIEDTAKLRVDYEVMRQVVVSPFIGITHLDYVDIDRTGFAYDAGFQVDYAVNRFLSVGMNYIYTNSDVDNAGPGIDDFERHVVGAYAKARF